MTPRSSVSDLTSHLGYWLRYVSNHVSQGFARKLAAREVTVAEWVLMRLLFDADATAPSILAAEMAMTRGAITKLADRLIAKGFVARAANPTDGRAQTLSLTATGRGIVPELAVLADRNDAEFFDHLSDDDRSHLERLLKEIVELRDLASMPVD